MFDEINCRWCGKPFKRNHAPEKYCSEYCRKEARKHQNRIKSNKWYQNHKHELTEKQRWGLGSSGLGQHSNKDFIREQEIIQRELRRLKIRI